MSGELLYNLDEQGVERLLDQSSAGKRIKDRLIPHLHECGNLIIREREAQAVTPYTVDDMRHVVHSGVMTLRLFRHDTRLSGRPVFEDHLASAATGVVKRAGRTEKHVVAEGHNHDTREDKRERVKNFGDFFGIWKDTFRSSSDPILEASKPFVRRVWGRVGILSKPPKLERADAPQGRGKKELPLSEHFLQEQRARRAGEVHRKIIASLYDIGPEVFDVKLCGDRWSNTETAEHQTLENQGDDARETYDLCRLGFLLGNHKFAPQLGDMAARILFSNAALFPDGGLYKSYTLLREQRMKASLDVKQKTSETDPGTSLREHLCGLTHSDILSHQIYPVPLSQLTLQLDAPITDLGISDLSISSREPLYEIEVMVKPGSEGDFGANLDAVSRHIRKYFSEAGDRIDERRDSPDQLPQRGVHLTIYSRKWGLLRFRVNDSVSEARSKRGITPVSCGSDDEIQLTPPRIRAAAKRILHETKDDPRLVLPRARELLIRPEITVYTYKKREPKILPKGATIFDFAETVHTDFLIGYQRAIIHESADKSYPWPDPYAPLPDGVEIEIISSIDETQRDLSHATAKLKWRYFCAMETAATAMKKRYFRVSQSGDGEDIVSRGRTEARYMAGLFGMELEAVMSDVEAAMEDTRPSPEYEQKVARKYAEGWTKRQKAYLAIGAGEVDLLCITRRLLMSDAGEQERRGRRREPKELHIRVEVPHRSGEFNGVLDQFEAAGINLQDMACLPRERGRPYIFYIQFRCDRNEPSITPIMMMLLKLSDTYRLNIAGEEGEKAFRAHAPIRARLLAALE